MARSFNELNEQEILSLAINAEEDDSRIYGQFAERLKANYPETAKTLLVMRDEELGHAHRLMETFKASYGENLPFIRRQDVKGFLSRKPLWLSLILTVDQVRKEVETMEYEARNFYEAASKRTTNLSVRKLLNELALVEASHEEMAAGFRESMEKSWMSSVRRSAGCSSYSISNPDWPDSWTDPSRRLLRSLQPPSQRETVTTPFW